MHGLDCKWTALKGRALAGCQRPLRRREDAGSDSQWLNMRPDDVRGSIEVLLYVQAVGDLRATLAGSPRSPEANQASACPNCVDLDRSANQNIPSLGLEASADTCEDAEQP